MTLREDGYVLRYIFIYDQMFPANATENKEMHF
jgi:hypothetical protein